MSFLCCVFLTSIDFWLINLDWDFIRLAVNVFCPYMWCCFDRYICLFSQVLGLSFQSMHGFLALWRHFFWRLLTLCVKILGFTSLIFNSGRQFFQHEGIMSVALPTKSAFSGKRERICFGYHSLRKSKASEGKTYFLSHKSRTEICDS